MSYWASPNKTGAPPSAALGVIPNSSALFCLDLVFSLIRFQMSCTVRVQ